jgi:hypothetical protein
MAVFAEYERRKWDVHQYVFTVASKMEQTQSKYSSLGFTAAVSAHVLDAGQNASLHTIIKSLASTIQLVKCNFPMILFQIIVKL